MTKILANKETVVICVAVLVALIILAVPLIIYFSPANVMSRRIDAFCFLVESEEDDLIGNTYDALKKCGLHVKNEDNPYVMDDAFFEAYIKLYSSESLINNLYLVYSEFLSDDYCGYSSTSTACDLENIYSVLQNALEYTQVDIHLLSLPAAGTEGFYTQNPNEVPKSERWEVEGKFYNYSGENIRYQTKQCAMDVQVRGDYVIKHYKVYRYNPGAYGWKFGVFHNELPSWEYSEYDEVYYKGAYVEVDEIQEIEKVKSFSVGENHYLLYEKDRCSQYADTHQEFWVLTSR